jgi:5-carboxymethyl-2-hydroxymuconate isomerase
MPHLHLEYTANLPQRRCGVDPAQQRWWVRSVRGGVRYQSRAVKVETFKVGTGMGERAFVHVKLALLSGRSPQIKKQLSESLLAVLQDLCEWPAGLKCSSVWSCSISTAIPTQDRHRRVGLRPLPDRCRP